MADQNQGSGGAVLAVLGGLTVLGTVAVAVAASSSGKKQVGGGRGAFGGASPKPRKKCACGR